MCCDGLELDFDRQWQENNIQLYQREENKQGIFGSRAVYASHTKENRCLQRNLLGICYCW